MKLWQKNNSEPSEADELVGKFTVGKDREFDLLLAPFDVLGNMAHAKMLATIGLLTREESAALVEALKTIYQSIQSNPTSDNETGFSIQPDVEDIHSQIEFLLTEKLGDTGRKIHSARSRNDQVLVDLKLFLRSEIEQLVISIQSFFEILIDQSEIHKNDLLPGYTHLQLAMPSSFGLWFGAYAESLVDDVHVLKAAYDIVNKNPLGSAAGYGSSFPVNRRLTTALLGFDDLHYNVVYAQMSRGKTERIVAAALANIADTLAKLSMDVCLYINQNFDFISFPAALTTGSSIMPHKKNPDVFELIRSHSNRIKSLPNEMMMMTTNLPSGYHRDLQLLKEHLFPAFSTLKDCISIASLMLNNMEVKKDILAGEKYKYLFTVDAVNELVMKGVPFREAYKIIGKQVDEGSFTPPPVGKKDREHHEGSIGNLMNDNIVANMRNAIKSFHFEKYHAAINKLLS
jgi:argininosuccinate lyase